MNALVNAASCVMSASIDAAARGPSASIDPSSGRARTPIRSPRRISAATACIPAGGPCSTMQATVRAASTSPNISAGGPRTPVDAAANIFTGILCVPACVPHVLPDRALSLAIVLRHQTRRCRYANHRSQ